MTLVPVPTKTARCHSDIKGRRPFDVPANNVFSFSVLGRGSTQEPPCRPFEDFNFLHCWRNLDFFGYLQLVLLYQNLPQSKDVESIPRTEFHDGSTIFSCQTLMDCLCTCDAFHISDSIRCF